MVDETSNQTLDLDDREIRVLGSLIEKELSTPDYYPMTVNALTTACNQKTNRDPVVEYDEADVVDALELLQRRRLVGHASSTYGRADKYRHALAEVLSLDRPQLAVLASIMLRGPQTIGELRGRTARMHEFDSLDAVEAVLDELQQRDPPLIVELPRRPGQKEARYSHLFGGPPEEAAETGAEGEYGSGRSGSRIEALEDEIAELRRALDELTTRFDAFRSQFE